MEKTLSDGTVIILDEEDADLLLEYEYFARQTIDDRYIIICAYEWGLPGKWGRYGRKGKWHLLSHKILERKLGRTLKNEEMAWMINRNNFDLRRNNLAVITNKQSRGQRLGKNNTSGFKGVYFDKKKEKWVAVVFINRKAIYVGSFNTKLEAAYEYDDKVRQVYGELAVTNESLGLFDENNDSMTDGEKTK